MQLLAMLFPKAASDMAHSLVLDAQQGGGLPLWPSANNEACQMVGNPSSPIIADVYAFGARDFDAKAALAAMLKGATDPTTKSVYCPEWPGLDRLPEGWFPGSRFHPLAQSPQRSGGNAGIHDGGFFHRPACPCDRRREHLPDLHEARAILAQHVRYQRRICRTPP